MQQYMQQIQTFEYIVLIDFQFNYDENNSLQYHEIIELSFKVININTREVVYKRYLLIRPDVEVQNHQKHINGISKQDLEQQETLGRVIPQFEEIISTNNSYVTMFQNSIKYNLFSKQIQQLKLCCTKLNKSVVFFNDIAINHLQLKLNQISLQQLQEVMKVNLSFNKQESSDKNANAMINFLFMFLHKNPNLLVCVQTNDIWYINNHNMYIYIYIKYIYNRMMNMQQTQSQIYDNKYLNNTQQYIGKNQNTFKLPTSRNQPNQYLYTQENDIYDSQKQPINEKQTEQPNTQYSKLRSQETLRKNNSTSVDVKLKKQYLPKQSTIFELQNDEDDEFPENLHDFDYLFIVDFYQPYSNKQERKIFDLIQIPIIIYDVAKAQMMKDGFIHYFIRPENIISPVLQFHFGLKEICDQARNSKYTLAETLKKIQEDLKRRKVLQARYATITFNPKYIFDQLHQECLKKNIDIPSFLRQSIGLCQYWGNSHNRLTIQEITVKCQIHSAEVMDSKSNVERLLKIIVYMQNNGQIWKRTKIYKIDKQMNQMFQNTKTLYNKYENQAMNYEQNENKNHRNRDQYFRKYDQSDQGYPEQQLYNDSYSSKRFNVQQNQKYSRNYDRGTNYQFNQF